MKKNIAVIFGDGIGPEVTQQAINVLNAVAKTFSHEFEYTYSLMGADAVDKTGDPLPDATIEACLNSDAEDCCCRIRGRISDPDRKVAGCG